MSRKIKFKQFKNNITSELTLPVEDKLFDHIDEIKSSVGFFKDTDVELWLKGKKIKNNVLVENIMLGIPILVNEKKELEPEPAPVTNVEYVQWEDRKFSIKQIHPMLSFFMMYIKIVDKNTFLDYIMNENIHAINNNLLNERYKELLIILFKQMENIPIDKYRTISLKFPSLDDLDLLCETRKLLKETGKYENNSEDIEIDITKINALQKLGYNLNTAYNAYFKFNKNFQDAVSYLTANVTKERIVINNEHDRNEYDKNSK